MTADRVTVDRRELTDALRTIGGSFDVEIDGALLSGGAFSLAEMEEKILDAAHLGQGDRTGEEVALTLLSETIADRAGDGRALAPDDRMDAVWPDTPLALRTALWARGRYATDAVRLDLLGRVSGLAMSFALMTVATAVLLFQWTIALIGLGVFVLAATVFMRAPGAMDKDATVQSVAVNLLENNLAKMVAGGGRVAPETARAILRALFFRKLALDPGKIGPETVLRPRYHPFRIRRTAFR